MGNVKVALQTAKRNVIGGTDGTLALLFGHVEKHHHVLTIKQFFVDNGRHSCTIQPKAQNAIHDPKGKHWHVENLAMRGSADVVNGEEERCHQVDPLRGTEPLATSIVGHGKWKHNS